MFQEAHDFVYLIALDLKSCVFCVNNSVPGVAPFREPSSGNSWNTRRCFLGAHTGSFLSHFCHPGVDFFVFLFNWLRDNYLKKIIMLVLKVGLKCVKIYSNLCWLKTGIRLGGPGLSGEGGGGGGVKKQSHYMGHKQIFVCVCPAVSL